MIYLFLESRDVQNNYALVSGLVCTMPTSTYQENVLLNGKSGTRDGRSSYGLVDL